MTKSCEHCNEVSCFIQGQGFIGYLSDYKLLKNESSYLCQNMAEKTVKNEKPLYATSRKIFAKVEIEYRDEVCTEGESLRLRN